jgi:hypothetical protein
MYFDQSNTLGVQKIEQEIAEIKNELLHLLGQLLQATQCLRKTRLPLRNFSHLLPSQPYTK